MITVKRGDTHSISWSTNLDLTGASVTVWARPKSGSSVQLTTVITDADDGEFSHTLTGALAVGEYRV